MKIAVLSPHRILGGGETSLRSLMRHMPQHEWLVLYRTDRAGAPTIDYADLPHVRAERADNPAAQCAAHGAQLLLFYGEATPAALEVADRMSRRPRLIFLAKTSDHNGTYKWWLQCRERVDAAIALSPEIGLEMVRVDASENWPGAAKVFVIPNGVDTRRYASARERDGSVRTVAYVGRINGGKGIERLPKALIATRCRLLLAGPIGDYGLLDRVRTLCRRWRVPFHHLPATQYPVEAYERADLLVLPSEREGCPNAVLEAAAMGVPALATRVGTLPDYWTGDKNIFFLARRGLNLREALRRLLQRPNLVAKVGRGAAARARSFSAERQAAEYQRVFDGAMGDLPPARGYILGRFGGEGDALCAEPLLAELRRRDIPYKFRSEARVAALLEREHRGDAADRPVPLVYSSGRGHVCNQYLAQIGLEAERTRPTLGRRPGRALAAMPRVGLHARAKKPCKQWLLSRWASLAAALRSRCAYVVQVDGGVRIDGEGVAHAPMADIETYAACVADLDLLITTEGFPHHLAQALGVACVVLWPGSVRPELTAYASQHVVAGRDACQCDGATYAASLPPECQGKGSPRCMRSIEVDDVLQAVDNALAALRPVEEAAP